jgi:four helix bundle protein
LRLLRPRPSAKLRAIEDTSENSYWQTAFGITEFLLLHLIPAPESGGNKDQLNRASSSVPLNLAEGSGRETNADQKRFFVIAFASLRECQSILDLEFEKDEEIVKKADVLAAHLYKLIEVKKAV